LALQKRFIMALIPLTGAGSLFVRLGHLAGYTNDIESFSGGTATTNVLVGAQVPTRLAQIEADYAAGTADYTDVDGIVSLASQFQQTPQSFLSYLQQLATNTLITMANLSVPLIVLDVPHALTLLIGQMNSASQSVNSSTPGTGSQTSFGSPGNRRSRALRGTGAEPTTKHARVQLARLAIRIRDRNQREPRSWQRQQRQRQSPGELGLYDVHHD
jgi:hypothetical protein